MADHGAVLPGFKISILFGALERRRDAQDDELLTGPKILLGVVRLYSFLMFFVFQ